MKRLLLASLVLSASVTACGGGGGTGPGQIPNPPPTNAPPTNAPPTSYAVAGNAVDYASGSPLAGFTVTLGVPPNAAACNGAQTQTLNLCGTPASPIQTEKTASDGSFSIAGISPGTYMLTIGKDATYATLHRSVTVSGPTSLGALKIAALTGDEQAWIVDINKQRATVSSPTSFANVAIDEYAEEQARAWAAGVANGSVVYGDAGFAPFNEAYTASPGSLYGPAHVLDLVGSPNAYLQADANWMAEKSNCPNGNWQTCSSAPNTVHYINVSNTNTVWAGVGESANPFNDPPYGQEWAYGILLVENVSSAGPASIRALAFASHADE